MAKQQSCHKFVYKLSSRRLKDAGWDLTLPLSAAMKNKSDIVALNDSQILRWICELNGARDIDTEVEKLKKELYDLKKQPKSRKTKNRIKDLYDRLYSLQYQKDYLCIIMDSDTDYDRANQGFSVNGYRYHRLLGTNGGIKNSTITYIGDRVYQEIVKRMDNGRDKTKPIIPAKLEAYQALICSASTPVTMPRILIVQDCRVRFKEDVIKISDENGGEPELKIERDCLIDYCDSDGYGLMSPAYSRVINRDLYGEAFAGRTISGVNTRYAWTKGMLFTFDFAEFAKRVNHGEYMVRDAWGTQRDIRDYDVILTTSMVKLWDSYQSLEHFIACCSENHYQFSVTKTTPHRLEHVRNANYQFLQTYELSDAELYELCRPTIEDIAGVLGNDWRKTVVFLKGMFLNDDNIDAVGDDFVKAIMIEPGMTDDPFITRKLHALLYKRIEMAAKGSIQLPGNFAIVSGDPYALAQSVFGLPVTGLLKAGEVYHRYWIDKNVSEIALFRAPMTCHNNIRKRKVVHNDETDFWYRYNTTGIILNSWDTTCDALNGADKDSDAFFTTDHPILVAHTKNAPTIECIQRKAEKIIPAEQDLVAANKLAFGDEIGTTTNRITAMLERQAAFAKDSEEYRMLDYRIKCGQHYQQCAIDKAKGILAKPMPKYWYSTAACQKLPDATEAQKQFKALCLRIVADKKPYFMKYVYPDLHTEWKRYLKNANSKCIREFKMSLADLRQKPDKTICEQEFLKYYEQLKPVGTNPCTVNRIAWLMEDTFSHFISKKAQVSDFDYRILKSGAAYSKHDYLEIKKQKQEYDACVQAYQKLAKSRRLDKEDTSQKKGILQLQFRASCEKICPNEKELCDIVIDLCYSAETSKQFAWDICGKTIIDNLLEKKNHTVSYPVRAETGGEFQFAGESFVIHQKRLKEVEELSFC